MKLTQKQEWIIARYLRAVEGGLGHLPEAAREQALTRLSTRIYQELRARASTAGPFEDQQVLAVLQQLGNPADYAARGTAPAAPRLDAENRIWLGVCGGLADRLEVDVRWVRLAAVLLGVTGPIVLTAYLALYFEVYLTATEPNMPRIDKRRLARYVSGTLLAAIALHAGSRLAIFLIREGISRWSGVGPLPELGHWDWLRAYSALMLFWVVLVTLPIAVLSALPVPNRWDYTGKRVVQAVLSLYALAVSFGIACSLVGAILHVIQQVNLRALV